MRLNAAPNTRRSAAAALETAVVAPLLVFLMVISLDYGRIFYYSLTIANCARNGALWASDPYAQAESPYQTLEEAALADAPNLNDPNNQPTVTSTTGTDSSGNSYVEVTVTYQFQTITSFPGVADQGEVSRTVRMPVAPENPDL